MVAHIYRITRNSPFSEVLRPTAVGPVVTRAVLILLLFLFPLLDAGAQVWQLRASLVELPDGVLIDPTHPAAMGYRGFTGLNLLTGDLALLTYARGEMSAFYRIESLDGGAERFYFRLTDERTVEMVRVPATQGRYHYLYRLESGFFNPSGESGEVSGESGSEDLMPEPAGNVPAGNAGGKVSPEETAGETAQPAPPSQILYVGTMMEGVR